MTECKHIWISEEEITKMALPVCKGEVGPTEMFPAFSIVEPGSGTACLECYRVWGAEEGVRNSDLVSFDTLMKELQSEVA